MTDAREFRATVPSWVVFDLGGVLFDLQHDQAISAFEKFGVSRGELDDLLHEMFTTPPAEFSLTERAVAGELTADEYIAAFRKSLNGRVEGDQIRGALNMMIGACLSA